jgi:hypothetical protein
LHDQGIFNEWRGNWILGKILALKIFFNKYNRFFSIDSKHPTLISGSFWQTVLKFPQKSKNSPVVAVSLQ